MFEKLTHLDQSIQGHIWLKGDPKHENNDHFHLLDYLFNGLLSGDSELLNSTGLYISKNFNYPVFLLRIESSEDPIGEVEKNLDFMLKNRQPPIKIALYNDNAKNKHIVEKLTQKYKNKLIFQEL